MKLPAILLAAFAAAHCNAQPPDSFFRALHQVETSGRHGPIRGDGGRALGPLQIHVGYWMDAGVPGRYEDCADYAYSVRVVSAYLRKHAPRAWAAGDVRTLARVHNGGPAGARKAATASYASKVIRALR